MTNHETQVPCPKCTKLNDPTAEYCWACYYDFVPNTPVAEKNFSQASSALPSPDNRFTHRRKKNSIFIGGLLFIISTIFLLDGVNDASQALKARKWLSTPGVVTVSEMRKFRIKSHSTPRAYIRFEYDVNRVKYSSNDIYWGRFHSAYGESEKAILDRYPKGVPVTVFYNPSRPDQAILENALAWRNFSKAFYSSILILFLLGGLLGQLWKRPKQPS